MWEQPPLLTAHALSPTSPQTPTVSLSHTHHSHTSHSLTTCTPVSHTCPTHSVTHASSVLSCTADSLHNQHDAMRSSDYAHTHTHKNTAKKRVSPNEFFRYLAHSLPKVPMESVHSEVWRDAFQWVTSHQISTTPNEEPQTYEKFLDLKIYFIHLIQSRKIHWIQHGMITCDIILRENCYSSMAVLTLVISTTL